MKRLSVVAWLLILLGAVPAYAGSRDWLAPDFFVDTVDPGFWFNSPGEPIANDCRGQIARAICVHTDRFSVNGLRSSRTCSENNSRYIAFFEAVYDRFPPVLQKMFCSVRRLSVEPNLESIAYAGMQGSGAVVGFRKSVIDEDLDLSTLLSWKEQLPFGGQHDSYDLSDKLPHTTIESAARPVEDLAFYVLAHEFAHLFDFANDLNGGCFPGADCRAEPGSWTELSWVTTLKPKAAFDFPSRQRVCFYNCDGHIIGQKSIAPLYEGLAQTGFVTLYAATNVYDDFAESLAFYMLDEVGGFKFELDTRQGKTYDFLSKVHAKQFKDKYDYVDTFLHSRSIQYP